MSLTTKDSPVLDLGQGSSSARGQNSRANPVCLEVPITILNVPAENSAAAAGPRSVREEGRTVIVFEHGAVLRLAGNIPPGQTLMLSSPQGREALCRVISARNLPSVKGYVEVEFVEPLVDFWGLHPADANAPNISAPSGSGLESLRSGAHKASLPDARPADAHPADDAAENWGKAPTFEDIEELVSMPPQKQPPAPAPESRRTTSHMLGIALNAAAQKEATPSAGAAPLDLASLTAELAESLADLAMSPKLHEAAPSRAAVVSPTEPAAHVLPPATAAMPPAASVLPATPATAAPISMPMATLAAASVAATTSSAGPEIHLPAAATPAFRSAGLGTMGMGGMLDANDASIVPQISPTRGKMPLLIGGAAVLLAAIGAGLFFTHRSQSSATSSAGPASIVQPAAPSGASASFASSSSASASSVSSFPSAVAPAGVLQSSSFTQPLASAAGPVAKIISSDSSESKRDRVTATSSELPGKSAPARSPRDLKMAAPAAPRDAARLAEPGASGSMDLPGMLGAAPAANLLTGGMRADQPLPPGGSSNANSAMPRSVAASTPVSGAGSSSVREPRMISSVRPVYPELAKQSNVQGNVLLSVEVDAAGNVVGAKVISGPMFLRQAATDAVKQWKYAPAVNNGKPVAAEVSVSVAFHLK